MFALNLLILPILLVLALELFGFIYAIQRFRSPRLTLALFILLPLLNFGLYEGTLKLWPNSWLDQAQHDEIDRRALEEGASQGRDEGVPPADSATPDEAKPDSVKPPVTTPQAPIPPATQPAAPGPANPPAAHAAKPAHTAP